MSLKFIMTFGNVIPERNVKVKLKICLFSNMVLTFKQCSFGFGILCTRGLGRFGRWRWPGDYSEATFITWIQGWWDRANNNWGRLRPLHSTQHTHFRLPCLSVPLIIKAAFTSVSIYVGSALCCATRKQGSCLLVHMGVRVNEVIQGKAKDYLKISSKGPHDNGLKEMCDGPAMRKAKKKTPFHPQGCAELLCRGVTSFPQFPLHILPQKVDLKHTTETAWEKNCFQLVKHVVAFPF